MKVANLSETVERLEKELLETQMLVAQLVNINQKTTRALYHLLVNTFPRSEAAEVINRELSGLVKLQGQIATMTQPKGR